MQRQFYKRRVSRLISASTYNCFVDDQFIQTCDGPTPEDAMSNFLMTEGYDPYFVNFNVAEQTGATYEIQVSDSGENYRVEAA